jgi:hypothetical protein
VTQESGFRPFDKNTLAVTLYDIANPAPRVDKSGNPGIGTAHKPAAVFYGAKYAYADVLHRFVTVPKPRLVGNRDQKIRPIAPELTYQPGESVFKADQYSEPDFPAVPAAQPEYGMAFAGGKIGDRGVFQKPE